MVQPQNHGCIVAATSKIWKGISCSSMDDIIVHIHNFIFILLLHMCPHCGTCDNHILAFIMNDVLVFTMDDFLASIYRAIRYVEFILVVKLHSTLVAQNQYFGITFNQIHDERRLNTFKPLQYVSF